MLVGYARTSTLDQTAGLEAQLRLLKAEGCERIFKEQVSSVDVRAREMKWSHLFGQVCSFAKVYRV